MQKITPCIWLDGTAEAAAETYTSLFRDSEILEKNHHDNGSVFMSTCRLAGLEIQLLNGGPDFVPTPAISFMVNCETADEVDRFGVSWQLMQGTGPQSIAPELLFVGDQFGKAEEAINRWTGLFPDSSVGKLARDDDGAITFGPFRLAGQDFIAMESNLQHDFAFTEGTSFAIICEDQAEVDHYWNRLGDGGDDSQCGWLKDRFGVSWQIVPRQLPELLNDPDQEKAQRVFQAMLQMGKIDITEIEHAAASA